MSSYKKSQGTTSRLLKIAETVLNATGDDYTPILQSLKADHIDACKAAISNEELRQQCVNEVSAEFEKLSNFLEAVQTIEEVSTRSRDIIVGYGEKLSSRIMSFVLKNAGLDAVYCPLDKILPHYSSSDDMLLDQGFYDELSEKVAKFVVDKLAHCSASAVPVVTGFIGHVPGGIMNAVGRGYSDFTAALLSAGLKRLQFMIKELQIWKEVDGIFTADPRQVPTARLLSTIYPDEAAELTYYGSEVIHPFTMEQVIRAKVSIRIKNTFQPAGPGTQILISDQNKDKPCGNEDKELLLGTAVSVKTDVICLNIKSNRKSVSHGFLANVFSTLDKYGVVVDLISTSEVHVSLVMGCTSNNLTSKSLSPISTKPPKLEAILKDLRPLGECTVVHDVAILSLVGKQMKNSVGIAGKMFSTLAKEKVNIEIISQGSSEINISCVILESDATRALKRVHDVCILGVQE